MKFFTITGTCIPKDHYMVDTTKKIDQVYKMVEQKKYFVINRPRQYGKTTTLSQLEDRLLASDDYFPIVIGFEGYGEASFSSEAMFCSAFLMDLGNEYNVENNGYSNLFLEHIPTTDTLQTLSLALKNILQKIPKKVVLMIDEVDKSSNNELFIHFLGMLREKYLKALKGKDITFHSVILAGVNDIRTLKQKIRPEAQSQQNSPWNIAVPFAVEMSFNPAEIETMLVDYMSETGIQMDTKVISEKIYFYTSGYPFLVSNICRIIAEEILPTTNSTTWEVSHIDQVITMLKYESNTLFDVLAKNLDSYPELYEMMENIVLGSEVYTFNVLTPLIHQAYMYGFIACDEKQKVKIHNKIFELVITSYIIDKNSQTKDVFVSKPTKYYLDNGRLDFEMILQRFQEVVKEKHSKAFRSKDDNFLERDFRLLFLIFLHPILNCKGFTFQEVEISEERRLDVVVTFLDEKFVVELKLWNGPKYHEKGKARLKQYMQAMSIDKGYMLILDKTKTKVFTNEVEDGILMVYV